MNPPETLLSHIKENDKFYIVPHIFPDGDALGSALALESALCSLGKKAIVFSRDSVPDMFDFLPESGRIAPMSDLTSPEDATLLLIDCNAPNRADIERVKFKYTIVIDHHETESDFGDIRWVLPKSPATGLMIYFLIKSLGVDISSSMALNIYAALAVDTGIFRYSNTTAESLSVASDLISKGVRPSFVADRLHNNWTEAKFMLLKHMLNSIEIQKNTAICFITNDMLKKTGAKPEDTDNFVNFPIMINTIKVAALFKETGNNFWKASLRSRGDVNVAKIAEKLGGGGHKNAAGFRITADIETAKKALLESLDGIGESSGGD
ncbi:DHH family phosphoesterase [Candidatus Magnetominusculus xianensis]|uniref:Phosphoesterase n=1 Tax=Candidatus Magnetominusculus xianensis TaxID=1748249 RepID=A0ABR5SHL3_9BACT|nr:bifunctional oligoribonuclease/PAP phosphatase NrnA [Candidatus Magnetominusculus xianensis]KWT91575.1 phosphoesterase [Candidatus Magnetominusculus xianensis]MBF0404360.1 bifunctional oligoribonuclease/PAP phosphatase NrnA [Nitrospirota bacterium]